MVILINLRISYRKAKKYFVLPSSPSFFHLSSTSSASPANPLSTNPSNSAASSSSSSSSSLLHYIRLTFFDCLLPLLTLTSSHSSCHIASTWDAPNKRHQNTQSSNRIISKRLQHSTSLLHRPIFILWADLSYFGGPCVAILQPQHHPETPYPTAQPTATLQGTLLSQSS